MVIPADWKEVRLGEVCEFYQPTTIGQKDFQENGEFIVYGANGPIGRYHRFNHENPEVTVSCRGTCGTVNVTPPKVWITGNAMVVRPRTQLLSKFILKYILQTIDYSKVITGAAQPQITGASLSPCLIMVPPLKEQEAIAEALSDADAAIESLDALIAKKRDVKQAMMQQLITGRTRLPGFSAEWKEVRLGDLLGYEQPTKYLVSSSDYVEGGQVPVLTAGKSFLLGYSDDTYGIYTSLPTIIFDDFTTATQWVDFEFKVKSSACKMLRPKNGVCNLRYVFERLRAMNYQTSDHKRHWISVFCSMEMLMPTLKEQEAIAGVLSEMDEELEALIKQASKLRMVKEGMMKDLLTGKVRLV